MTTKHTTKEAARLRKLLRESSDKINAERALQAAAPDLLSACEAFQSGGQITTGLDANNCVTVRLPIRVIDAIANAVKKARGE